MEGMSGVPENSTDAAVDSTALTDLLDQRIAFKITKLLLYAVIFVVSVVGNTLVCIVIVRRRRMRTVTNCFILNLAVADLAITCICIPFDIPVQENEYKWPYGPLFCRVLYPLQTMAMFASIFTLTAVSLNRFWAIVYPLHQQMTKRYAKVFILVIWVLSALLSLPYCFALQLNEETTSCEENWPGMDYRKAYTVCLFLLQYAFPLTIIAIAYLKIAREMHSCIRNNNNTVHYNNSLGTAHQREGKKVIRMLVVVTVLFAICVLPNNIMWLWLDFGNGEQYAHFWDMVVVTNIILFANSAANPVAYTICHENFREAFRLYITCDRSIFKDIIETSMLSKTWQRRYSSAMSAWADLVKRKQDPGPPVKETRETNV